jgi:hypothetical protein
VPPAGGTGEAPPVWPAHAQGQVPPPGYPPGYPPPGYPPAPAPGYPPAPAPGYPAYAYPQTQTSTNAIVGLILAIVAWVVCPIIPAIVALVLAQKSSQEIAASGGRVGGAGLNTATRILSWINIGLYAAVLVIIGLFFLIAAIAGVASSPGLS